jgi:hypothetical protein
MTDYRDKSIEEQSRQLEEWEIWRPDELPENYPDDVGLEDGPFAWINGNKETLGIEYLEGGWHIRGDGSLYYVSDELKKAQEHAIKLLSKDNGGPSPMFLG